MPAPYLTLPLENQERLDDPPSSRDSLHSSGSLAICRDCDRARLALLRYAESLLPIANLEASLVHIPQVFGLNAMVIDDLLETVKPPPNNN